MADPAPCLKDIDIVILAGGLGTRIQDALGDTPKILAPIGDLPFLDILLSRLAGFGVKRVVLGSTGDTTTGYEMDYPYGELAAGEYDKVTEPWRLLMHTDPTRPKSVYGACKIFSEALGHWYSDRYDMSVLCIRLGAVLAGNRPTLRRQYPGWLDQQDCVDMIDRCLGAPASLKFDVFNAISDNKYRWRDIDHAKEVLGWEPRGSAEDHDLDDPGGWHQVLDGDQDLRRETGATPG